MQQALGGGTEASRANILGFRKRETRVGLMSIVMGLLLCTDKQTKNFRGQRRVMRTYRTSDFQSSYIRRIRQWTLHFHSKAHAVLKLKANSSPQRHE
jgi:hypothetical protein